MVRHVTHRQTNIDQGIVVEYVEGRGWKPRMVVCEPVFQVKRIVAFG
jgi:hypothetical protein